MPEEKKPVPISEDLEESLEDEGYSADELNTLLTDLHPVDFAALLEPMEPEERLELLRLMSDERAAEVLAKMTHEARTEITPRLGEDRLSRIIDHLDPDMAADILLTIPAQKENRVLEHLDREQREDIRTLRRYAPHTAGGLMTTNYISVPETATCDEVIRTIQGNIDAETINYIYVVDPSERLRGVCTMRSLLRNKPETPITGIMMSENLVFVGDTLDQEDVARVVQKYDMNAVPVVDTSFRLKGVVTVDDVLDVIQQEASEDILAMAGAGVVHPLHESVFSRVRARLPWL
ncbi:MAG: magnesium transporter, partial [Planctomycetota bacterium]